MKIGIITVWDSANLGSYLQALALQEIVKANGDEPFFIRTRNQFHTFSLFLGYNMDATSHNLSSFLKYYLKQMFHPQKTLREINKFRMYKRDWKLFDHIISVNEAQNLDIIIYGSDEIWNIRQQTFKNPIFWGKGFENKKKSAYAVSIGNALKEDYSESVDVFRRIEKFEKIYVRDSHSWKVLVELGYQVDGKICDPTLQIDIKEKMKSSLEKSHEKYIAIYSYGLTNECKCFIQKFAKERNLKTVAVSLYQEWCDEYYNCSPLEFGSILLGAEYVFTTTFHGTIFSILYHTKFVTYSSLPKVVDILDTVGLSSCMLPSEFSYEDLIAGFEQERVYEGVEKKIQELRKESISIYNSVLEKTELVEQFEICDKDNCTGCGACAFLCPANCISMEENQIGVLYPKVDLKQCIHCGKCSKVCPQIKEVVSNLPLQAFAAWSKDEEERKNSASGGIASEIYKYLLQKGYYVVGAKQTEDFSVKLIVTRKNEDIIAFKNSKYVFSSLEEVFPILHTLVANEKNICIVGMPCQIAAIKNVFPKYENIIYIDLICHGMTPTLYLKQHINNLKKQHNIEVTSISFRAPERDTSKFFLSLYNNEKCVYSKRLMHGDYYQIGYHKGISYRENCYNCKYARLDRVSDLTLGDYHGLGTKASCNYSSNKISVILANTEKGKLLIKRLSENNKITIHERPIEEPAYAEKQLQKPTEKSKYRLEFEKRIRSTRGDFVLAMKPIAKEVMKDQKKNNYICFKLLSKIKRILKGVCFDNSK